MAIWNRKIRRLLMILFAFLFAVAIVIKMVSLAYSKSSRHPTLFALRMQEHVSRSIKSNLIDNVWKGRPDDDRIVIQLEFKPFVDPNASPKRIVLHNGVASWDVAAGTQTFVRRNCQIKNCELVDFPVSHERYDARMFKEVDLRIETIDVIRGITPRHPDQIWIMFALESPYASPSYKGLNDVINWTATYRHDSTINTPYDKWIPFANFSKIADYQPDRNYAEHKTKMAAIFVSNCYSSNNRLEYIRELQLHMQVDVYGACGTMGCPRFTQQSCFEMLKREYKFYLAFENANCREYITEKFFLNALRHDVVPVVMGAHPDDYRRVAPPESFIHVEWFSKPRELAEYLKKLDKDDARYNDYFRWKSAGTFINTNFWCRLCSMLWDPQRPRLSVSNLDEWWRGDSKCGGKRERWLSKSDQINLNI